MYTNCTNTVAYRVIGSPDQLEEKLKIAQEGEKEANRLHATGKRVLTRVRDEKNKLQDSNTALGEELKYVRAQLANSLKENKKLRGSIFSMYLNYFQSSSDLNGTDIVMIAGILTGRPEEEVSGSSSDGPSSR